MVVAHAAASETGRTPRSDDALSTRAHYGDGEGGGGFQGNAEEWQVESIYNMVSSRRRSGQLTERSGIQRFPA